MAVIAFLIIAAILVLLVAKWVLRIIEIRIELDYIRTEIKRTKGESRKHWVRQKRRLLLSVLPFFKY